MQLEIVVRSERAESRRLVFADSGVLTFGRHPDSSVCLEGGSVSRNHAQVRVQNGCLRVEDLSTNGTWAEGRVLRRSSLDVPFGAPVQMGEYTVVIAALAESAPTPSAPARPLPSATPAPPV